MQPTIYQLAMICAALLGAGSGLVAVLSIVPATRQAARSIWPNLISLILTVGITVAALTAGGIVASLFVLVVFFRTNFEAAAVGFRHSSMSIDVENGLAAGLWAAGATALLGLCLLIPLEVAALVVTLVLCVAIVLARRLNGTALGVVFGILAFPLCPALVFALAARLPEYGALAVAAYMMVETFDGYALLGGKLWGRTKAFPRLSPGKTLEGLAIGVVMLLLTAAAVGHFLSGLPLEVTMPLAVLAGMLTLAGDLAASALKRRSGVKDFPAVSRMQGGVLDIYDSWITTFSGLVLMMMLAKFFG